MSAEEIAAWCEGGSSEGDEETRDYAVLNRSTEEQLHVPVEVRYGRGPFMVETYNAFALIIGPLHVPFHKVLVEPIAPALPGPETESPPSGVESVAPPPPSDDVEDEASIVSRRPVIQRLESYPVVHCGVSKQLMMLPGLGRGEWHVIISVDRHLLHEPFRGGTSPVVLYDFDLFIPEGPFRGADYSATSLSGRQYPLFASRIEFFDAVMCRMPMEWSFMRYSISALPISVWGFFLRNAQTWFPRTDKETSRAVSPPLLLSPTPRERFLLDLTPSCWGIPDYILYTGYVCNGTTQAEFETFNSKAKTKFLRNYSLRLSKVQSCYLTVNRDFRGTLYRIRNYHISKPLGTWLDTEYIEFLSRCHESDAFNYPGNIPTRSSLSHVPLRLMVIELWDAATDEPLAAAYGYQVGCAYHDCTMATFVRDHAALGSLLSHAGADLLQRCGVTMWYWGKELPYMTDYRRTARGMTMPVADFLFAWRRAAEASPHSGYLHTYLPRILSTSATSAVTLAPPLVRKNPEVAAPWPAPPRAQPPVLAGSMMPPMELPVPRALCSVVEEMESAVVCRLATVALLPPTPQQWRSYGQQQQ